MFLLCGCIQVHVIATVSSDDTVSGETRVGVEKNLVASAGGTDAVFAELDAANSCPKDTPTVTETHYDDGTYIGLVCTFDRTPLAGFNAQRTSGSQLSLTRTGDTYALSGVIDLSKAVTPTADTPSTAPSISIKTVLTTADIEVRFTFPGPVTSSTGKAAGRTVTFTPDTSGRIDIHATASAVASDGTKAPTGLIAGLVAGIVVVSGYLVVLVIRRPRGLGH